MSLQCENKGTLEIEPWQAKCLASIWRLEGHKLRDVVHTPMKEAHKRSQWSDQVQCDAGSERGMHVVISQG